MALAEKYDKDPECKAARISYKEHRSKIRKAKYEAERKKREKERAKIENTFKCKTAKEAAMQKFHTFSLLHPIK